MTSESMSARTRAGWARAANCPPLIVLRCLRTVVELVNRCAASEECLRDRLLPFERESGDGAQEGVLTLHRK